MVEYESAVPYFDRNEGSRNHSVANLMEAGSGESVSFQNRLEWPNSTIRTSWRTCCATSPTNLLGSGKTSANQIVQLVGRWSCQSPTRLVDSGSLSADKLYNKFVCGEHELVGQQVANLFVKYRVWR
jgi:hypothetical protein